MPGNIAVIGIPHARDWVAMPGRVTLSANAVGLLFVPQFQKSLVMLGPLYSTGCPLRLAAYHLTNGQRVAVDVVVDSCCIHFQSYKKSE